MLPQDFAGAIPGIGGFRNKLVNEYAEIDIKDVYRFLHNNLDDFTKFVSFIQN